MSDLHITSEAANENIRDLQAEIALLKRQAAKHQEELRKAWQVGHAGWDGGCGAYVHDWMCRDYHPNPYTPEPVRTEERPFIKGNIVRYIGKDTRWEGREGVVVETNYESHPDVPLVVLFPKEEGDSSSPRICFDVASVEFVRDAI